MITPPRVIKRVMRWIVNKVRDRVRGFTDANIESMQRKLDHGKEKFTDDEHSAFANKIQRDDDK
jgi:hypothetical protein